VGQSQDVEPKAAASVILLREGDAGVQIYLLRRHRKASFMSSSYVFPGGIAEDFETDDRVVAGRELFEESGVLLSGKATQAADREAWRRALNVDKADPAEVMAKAPIDVESLTYYAHWITPSVEKRRYSAKFFIAVMPADQVASPDNKETVDEVWVTPEEALARSKELALPPPQVRTCYELLEPAKAGIEGILDFARAGAAHAHPILPRACASDEGLTLLLPWDAEYETAGNGASMPMSSDHKLAWGASRFILSPEHGWVHR
jgi:8-oxo-dGTP pyrophosphatase MutT (NUDIX family)